jgi:hypothetical protein
MTPALWEKNNKKPAFRRVNSRKMVENRPFVGAVRAGGLEPSSNGLKGRPAFFALSQPMAYVFRGCPLDTNLKSPLDVIVNVSQHFGRVF